MEQYKIQQNFSQLKFLQHHCLKSKYFQHFFQQFFKQIFLDIAMIYQGSKMFSSVDHFILVAFLAQDFFVFVSM